LLEFVKHVMKIDVQLVQAVLITVLFVKLIENRTHLTALVQMVIMKKKIRPVPHVMDNV